MKYAAIADWAQEKQYPVTLMCDQLGVIRQGYYRWLSGGGNDRERADEQLTKLIEQIHSDLHGHPGVRRIWAEPASRGIRISPKGVWRLMKAAGLKGRHPKAGKKTTVAGQKPVGAPDLIGQDVTAAAANLRWCGDITYIKTVDGWVHRHRPALAQGRRLRRRRPHAHQPHHRALANALATRRPGLESSFTATYKSKELADFCSRNKVVRSRGRRATCYDNAVAESFFATYKKELIHQALEQSHRCPAAHIPLDRKLLQPAPAAFHPQRLDTTRIRTRI